MQRDITDIHRTLEYGQSHVLARKMLPFSLFGVLVGLFLMTPLEGESFQSRNSAFGFIVVILSLALLGMVIHRRLQPSVPSYVLSPQGVLIRDISDKPISWNEIIEVGFADVRANRDLLSTKVVKLTVSHRFYQAVTNGKWLDPVVAEGAIRIGEPGEFYVSYYQDVPKDEFHSAALLRWHAFSRHAAGKAAPEIPVVVSSEQAPTPARARTSVVERGSSIGVTGAFADLVRNAPPGFQLATVVALAGIAAISSNLLGFWSTAGQDRARKSAAESRAQWEKFEADRRATDAEQKRIKDMWSRQFKCMDHQAYMKDPDCQKK